MKLMSIAMKPVAFPPFPLERIEELTALMGGEGSVGFSRVVFRLQEENGELRMVNKNAL